MATIAPSSMLVSRHDVRFLLEDWLEISGLTERDRYEGQSLDDYRDILDMAEQLATEKFATHNRAADLAEPEATQDGTVTLLPQIKDAFTAYGETGLVGATVSKRAGGLQLPLVLGSAISAWFCAANAATANYAFLTTAAANTLARFGTAEQIETWVRPMAEGRFLGTMCLTEPQAGSSLADITTRAELQPDGSYRLVGTKMWISAGEHDLGENIVHLVLAKIPGGPSGVKGISLFVVPRLLIGEDGTLAERNDVVLAGVNHKLGQRGTINTLLSFGEGVHRPGGHPGAVGYLVGEPHRGLSYMFAMMNEARIEVGLAAAAIGYTGYLKACQYARERPQGRPLADRDPESPQVTIVAHPDVRRMLLAQKSYVEGALGLVLYTARVADDAETHPDPDVRVRANLLLELLTPLAKSWPAQWGLEANNLAIQVHGGYGYSREYDVEQHWRDNRLNMIHEGTHGIQALDLLGRKVNLSGGDAFAALTDAMTATIVRASALGGEVGVFASALEHSVSQLEQVTLLLRSERDRELALANAGVYLEACGHIVVSWLWLEQLLALGDRDDSFAAGKRQAAQYFVRYELPRTGPQLHLLGSLDRTVLDMQNDWL